MRWVFEYASTSSLEALLALHSNPAVWTGREPQLEDKASRANLLETNMRSTVKCNLGARLAHFEVLMVLSPLCSTKTVQVVGHQDLAMGDLDQGN